MRTFSFLTAFLIATMMHGQYDYFQHADQWLEESHALVTDIEVLLDDNFALHTALSGNLDIGLMIYDQEGNVLVMDTTNLPSSTGVFGYVPLTTESMTLNQQGNLLWAGRSLAAQQGALGVIINPELFEIESFHCLIA